MKRMHFHLKYLICTLAGLCLLFTLASSGRAQSMSDPYQSKNQSVLSSGPSLKIGVSQDGIYRIRYEDLVSQGLLNQAEPSSRINLYGNKAGMLPFFNTPDIPDDLSPLPILMQDGGDGMFGPGDYFLFFGQSPHVWTYDSSYGFLHQTNYYSDTTYYFVSAHSESAIRVGSTSNASQSDLRISTSIEHVHHESDLSNICNGSVHWMGERFSSSGQSQTVTLSTPNPANTHRNNAKILIQTAAHTNNGTASFTIDAAGTSMKISHTRATGSNESSLCTDMQSIQRELSVSSSQLPLSFSFQKSQAAGNGFIDFISLSYERQLSVQNQALFFRNPSTLSNRFQVVLWPNVGIASKRFADLHETDRPCKPESLEDSEDT